MAKIDSKGAREKLPFRRDPYWQRIEQGLFVGYRVSEIGGDGTWRCRWRTDAHEQVWRKIEPIYFTADEPGRDTKFVQASAFARKWKKGLTEGVKPKTLTVADAVKEYLKEKRRDQKERSLRTTERAEAAFNKHVLSDPIAEVRLDNLRSDMLKAWLDRRVCPRDPDDTESVRAAQNTANRERSRFFAVLSWAYTEAKLIASDAAWRGLKQFDAAAARREYLPSSAEIRALLAVASPEVARVARFLELTGCRPGEAVKATVTSFSQAGNTLTIAADTKTGRRVVPLSTEAIAYLSELAAGKIGNALLLVRDDGKAWTPNEFAKRFRVAREQAGLSAEFVAYSFRHRWITQAISFMEIGSVALAAGTSVEMIEQHYAKLQPERMRADLDRVALLNQKGLEST